MAKKDSYNPGPVSATGKDTASRNATVHGGRCERHSILSWERAEDFEELVAKWTKEFTPATEVERDHVQTIAQRAWMVRRCERNVNVVMSELMETKPNPLAWTKEEQGALTVMQRYLTTAQRHLDTAVNALKDLRKFHVAQRNLEERTKLKIADVMMKLEVASKVEAVVVAKLQAERVQELRSKNVNEWDLQVLRLHDEAMAREPVEGQG